MKKLVLIIVIVLLAMPSIAQKNVTSKIKKVTVFLKGAQIQRTASTSLKKGRTDVVFSGLSTALDANSIQVKGKGNFTIMSVYHQLNYLKKAKVDKRIKEMQDSVKLLTNQSNLQNQFYNALNQESQMLLANKAIGGTNTGVDVASLKSMADFYRTRLKDIYTRMYKIKQDNSKRNAKIQRLNQQIQQSRRNYQTTVSELVLDLDVKETTQAKFDITYLVRNASWYPQYDIRATDVHHPIQLHYRAMIRQNTGVEWKNVMLTVSTGNPSNNGVIPQLYPWYLNYYLNQQGRRMEKAYVDSNVEPLDMEEVQTPVPVNSSAPVYSYSTPSKAMGNSNNSSNYTRVSVGQTTTLFKISIPYTIPSTNKTVNVKIQKVELAADYRYYCVPKLSLDAFLQARITGWEELNLLAGNVNVFFDGTFVGKSRINPQSLSDTLDISLGKDASIKVERNKIKDKTGKLVIGSTKKMNIGWEISVRNGKAEKINITIQDQLPLSKLKEIEVELNKKDGAKYNADNGFLTWDLEIAAKKSVKKSFDYTVKYPKKYILANQW
ncbi:MAG: hypothetical protein DRI84_06665 [Bacteroidetes bacterium]|nr:MAG: hypothetical protein DRI84_06665 [Bacteroidota bacterium]